ncbi:MAG TPA: DUF2203 domain-containing protein [Acidimicrobiia bacterium]|nr:DUF2203 domain-containing protein [Acidimicrobiia bacterium]
MRIWTLAEANDALPRVAAAVDRIRVLFGEVRDARTRVQGNGGSTNGGGVHAAERELQALLRDLDDDGIVVRDPERGLIDFTAIAPSGRQYWLCWLPDEPAIGWWHWPEDGFAGRRPLADPPD